MHPVVGIISRDDRSPTKWNTGVEGWDEPRMGACVYANSGVALREGASDFERSIGRAVVEEDAFPIGFALAKTAPQTGRERLFSVPNR